MSDREQQMELELQFVAVLFGETERGFAGKEGGGQHGAEDGAMLDTAQRLETQWRAFVNDRSWGVDQPGMG